MASSFSSPPPVRTILDPKSPIFFHSHGLCNGGPQRSSSAAAYYNGAVKFTGNPSVIGSRRNPTHYRHVSRHITCFLGSTSSVSTEQLSAVNTTIPIESSHAFQLESTFGLTRSLLVADLDPEIAKLGISILGPFLSGFSFLFIVRIIMSWYPKLPVGEFPYVIAYAPTEPVLEATRKIIPPLAGVDVTPVVWFGIVTFLNEILLGPQGLLVLVSQQR